MTVLAPKAASADHHGRNLSLKRSAPPGEHGILVYWTVTTRLAACCMGNVGGDRTLPRCSESFAKLDTEAVSEAVKTSLTKLLESVAATKHPELRALRMAVSWKQPSDLGILQSMMLKAARRFPELATWRVPEEGGRGSFLDIQYSQRNHHCQAGCLWSSEEKGGRAGLGLRRPCQFCERLCESIVR